MFVTHEAQVLLFDGFSGDDIHVALLVEAIVDEEAVQIGY